MSGYRDDHDAALHRAGALERELSRAKRELADAEERLADREPRAEPHSRAEAKLNALRQKGRQPQPKETAPSRPPPSRPAQWPARLRLLRSVIFAGELLLSPLVAVFVVPLSLMAFYGAVVLSSLPTATVALIVFIAVPVALIIAPFTWANLALIRAKRWSQSRGYEVSGYLELLAQPPPKRDEGRLNLVLRFVDGAADDLDGILAGFDDALTPTGAGAFWRPYPITVQITGRSRIRQDNADTNYALHRWVRQLERHVLRPLHQVSPLERVELRR